MSPSPLGFGGGGGTMLFDSLPSLLLRNCRLPEKFLRKKKEHSNGNDRTEGGSTPLK